MEEIWLPIKGYEGRYEVSNIGNVNSLNYENKGYAKLLKPGVTKKGYLYVYLTKNGKEKKFFIHRIVAEAFIPNWFDYSQVNHIDEDKTNNHVDNLEWCSAKENSNHGTRNKRISEKNTNGKKSKSVLQYTKTGEFVKEWPSASECGRNGFGRSFVCMCCRGDRKTAYGFIWKYK